MSAILQFPSSEIMGHAGAGSLGVTTTGVARIAIVHAAPTEIWVVLALLPVTAAVVAGLSLVLDVGARAAGSSTTSFTYRQAVVFLIQVPTDEPGSVAQGPGR